MSIIQLTGAPAGAEEAMNATPFQPVNAFSRSYRPGMRAVCIMSACFALTPDRAEAVIVTGTQGNNISAPADPALAVRWGQVGLFRPSWGPDGFLGTPISANTFITAKHVLGNVGDTFTLASGSTYTTVARFNDPSSDLAIWQVAGTFPEDVIVPLYTAGSIAFNAPMYVFGVGSARGVEVSGTALGGGTELKGWRWGDYSPTNPVKSWGTNNVAGLADGGSIGFQLVYDFRLGGSSNEGTLGYGDSGGPVFIQQNGVWSLAGVNYGVQSQFNTTNTGGGFNAAIFDIGGLYSYSGGSWVYNTPTLADQPAVAYSTLTTNRLAWINETVASVPEPSTVAAAAIAGVCIPLVRALRRRFRV
jgi:hypothetical protein